MRTRLKNRRPAVTRELMFGGKPYLVSAGFDTSADPPILREVFITGSKTGQDVTNIIEDASVLISLALQYGATPTALARSMGRLPVGPVMPADLDRSDGGAGARAPSSLIGAVADLLVEMAGEGMAL